MTDPDLAAAPVDDAPVRPGRTPRGPGAAVVASLAVLLVGVAAVLAVLVVQDDSTGGLEEVRQEAGRFAEALVTYDYHDPEAHRDAVLELATGSFRQDYEDAFDQGLGQIITEVQAISQGSVNEVFVSSIDDGQAQAVVSLDIEVSGTSGERTLLDQYVLLTLVEVDDGWKVDDVTDLSFPTAGSGTPSESAETTTTTAAPPATSVP